MKLFSRKSPSKVFQSVFPKDKLGSTHSPGESCWFPFVLLTHSRAGTANREVKVDQFKESLAYFFKGTASGFVKYGAKSSGMSSYALLFSSLLFSRFLLFVLGKEQTYKSAVCTHQIRQISVAPCSLPGSQNDILFDLIYVPLKKSSLWTSLHMEVTILAQSEARVRLSNIL